MVFYFPCRVLSPLYVILIPEVGLGVKELVLFRTPKQVLVSSIRSTGVLVYSDIKVST